MSRMLRPGDQEPAPVSGLIAEPEEQPRRAKARAGQLISKGERVWLVRIYVGRDPRTGKRKYEAHTIHGAKKDAQTYLNGKLRERDLGVYASVQRTTMGALFDDLLSDYKINGKSYDWAELVVRVHLRPFFGGLKASLIGTDAVRRYIGARQQPEKRVYTDAGGAKKTEREFGPASNATINRELALLRRAFNLGKRATPPKVGAVPFIPMLAENNVRKGFFEHAAFLAVRRALPEEIRPVITFAYYTGCRKGEILALRWSQVDLAERVVRLEPGETKNDEARTIPLVADLYEVLKLQREARDRYFPECPWVFSRAGKPILNFRSGWDSACKAAGLVSKGDDGKDKPTRLFHDLRRTGVRNLIRAGVPERVAMMISGHKTRAVFDRYNIVSEGDLKDAARRLGEYLAHKDTPGTAAESERHTIGTPEAPSAVN
ncbi:MAG: tyrosine-type recombinase/integrase [Bryobacteraceae bacterium]